MYETHTNTYIISTTNWQVSLLIDRGFTPGNHELPIFGTPMLDVDDYSARLREVGKFF